MGKPFVVYNASAGSGKTYQLVLSYLSIFLKPGQAKRFKNILAITFTNAASKEMLERVLRGIKEISTPGESELKKEMAQKLGCTEQDLEKSALQALQAMLHNYSQIGIKTIDSFTTRVVKIFAEDLNFPPDFEVNLNPQALLEEFSAELIAVYGEDKEVSTMIDQWIDINLEQGKKINDPQKYLVDFLQKNISGKNRQYLDQFLANTKNKKQISEHIKSRTEEIKEKLFVLAEDVQSFTSQHGLRQEHFGGKSTCGLDKMIKAWKETNWDVNIGVTFPKTFISSDNPWHKDVGRKFDHLTEEILSRVRKAHDYFLAHKGEFYLLSSIQKQLPFLNSSAEILRRYDNFCYTKKQITLDRISDRISELLENNPTPYIYEKIGNAYRHILIDEFQDTSVQAWENFLPLVSNAISQGGSTTVVGDAKQSIYRFTGAEVGQIVSLPKLLSESPSAAEHENLLSASYQAVDLDKNYRSGYEIVAFNNDFLEHMAPFMDNEFQAYYLNGKQEAIKKYPGYLEVSYLQEKENTQEEQFDFLLKSIQKCFDNGISPNDINVLAKNKKELKEFQEFLKHHEIPSYSEENNFLIEHPYAEVIFLALRFLCNREKEPSLVRMLSLLHNINDKVFNLSSSYNDLLEISGYNVKLKPGAIADFFSLENFWSRESLTEKVLHLYQQFSFDRELPALRQFFQVCMDYETTQGSNLNDFINHLEKNKEDFPLASAESDSIILRTVHKSKGLSLHTVIMPHLSWQKKGNHVKEEWIRIPSSMPISQLCPIAQIELKSTKLKDTEFWNYVIAEKHNEFIDDLNLYYVGFTRAKENLFLFSQAANTKNDGEVLPAYKRVAAWLETLKEKDSNKFIIGVFQPEKEKDGLASISIQTTLPELNRSVVRLPTVESDEIKRGKVMHLAFSKYQQGMQLEEFKARVLKDAAEIIHESDLEKLYSQCAAWINSSKQAKATFCEREFVFEQEIIRPDRIDVYEDELVVSDLKTGAQDPAHHKQIKAYIRCATEVFKKPGRGFLLYTDLNQKVELHED